MICPAVVDVMELLMADPPPDPLPISAPVPIAYWWWFHALKKSPLSLKLTCSAMRKFFPMPMSQLLIPGWRSQLRGVLP